jgi:hypothetical protein
MVNKLRPSPSVWRMMLFTLAVGLLIVPLAEAAWTFLNTGDAELVLTLLTGLFGTASTFIAFAKEERDLWSFVKIGALAILVYNLGIIISTLMVSEFRPPEDEYALLGLALIFGYFLVLGLGLLLGWIARLVIGWTASR